MLVNVADVTRDAYLAQVRELLTLGAEAITQAASRLRPDHM
jgi:hypothetical protein